MLDKRLEAVTAGLREIDPADKEALVAFWRKAYRRLLTYTLHGMHERAWEYGIATETAAEWVEGIDLTHYRDLGIPALGVRAVEYFRGHEIGIKVEQPSRPGLPLTDEPFAYDVSVRASDDDTDAFTDRGEGFATLALAYRAGMQAAIAFLMPQPDL